MVTHTVRHTHHLIDLSAAEDNAILWEFLIKK